MPASAFRNLQRGTSELAFDLQAAFGLWEQGDALGAVEFLTQLADDCETLAGQARESARELAASVGSSNSAIERTTSTWSRITGKSAATVSSPRSIQPANRLSACSARPLFLLPGCAVRSAAPPLAPPPCGARAGATGLLDRRSECLSRLCSNRAGRWRGNRVAEPRADI